MQLKQVNDAADRRGWYRPQVEQHQYSLIARKRFEQDVRPVMTDKGMGVIWSPLAWWLLSGKYDNGIPENTRLAEMEWLKDLLMTGEEPRSSSPIQGDCRRNWLFAL
ncbi:MAG: hypothetical protein U0165_08860 [Polyangiaceae bacterium]